MSSAKKKMDIDRHDRGLRELRLLIPDARSEAVRRRVAASSAALSSAAEDDAMRWIEAVSVFDDPDHDRER